jgi:hypothetical protein
MKLHSLVVLTLITAALAQNASAQKSVTVPITLDHNRVVVDVDLALPDGTTQRTHAWIDNGDAEFWVSKRLAGLLQLTVVCNGQVCGATPSPGTTLQFLIGGLNVALPSSIAINVPGMAYRAANSSIAPGMSAEINIPSTILRNYDVLLNFPGHELTLAPPGTLKFNGSKTKAEINPQNGLIQIPSQIERKKYNLALDFGASISLLAPDLFNNLASAHPAWPHMTGAVGPANMWGADNELNQKLMRIDRIQYGPLFLTGVPVAEFSKENFDFFSKRAGDATAGLIGADVMANYRVGIDYAHSAVYFDIGRLFNFPEFDVIGLILRPEEDGRFPILGSADYDGKSSVPEARAGDHLVAVDGIPTQGSTLGQVLLMLGGEAGEQRRLTIEREGKQMSITATVQHFLAEAPTEDNANKKKH